MSQTFEELGISKALINALAKAHISVPTPIQEAVIPKAIAGGDIIAQSPTGTGKTLAYLLPLFLKLQPEKKEMQAVIVAPTHELSMQIIREIEKLALASELPVTVTSVIGNVNIMRQIDKLKTKPHILVGSIGRIYELMEKKKITAHTIKTIIIDEADRSMDSRDYNGIKALVKATQKDRQMILVSATITEDIHIKSKELLQSPQLILLDTQPVVAATVEHWYFVGDQRDKLDTIRRIVRAKKIPAALVFVNHSDDIDLIVHKLNNIGLKAAGLYSSMDKVQRKNAMTHLHAKKIELLVATDLAARGLDFPDMPVVFHLDLPLDPQVYLHRSGRTGRAGKSGISIAVLNRRELEWILEYPTKLNIFPVEKIISRAEIQDAKKA